MPKHRLNINVHDASVERIKWTLDTFENVYLSFSAGKDSTVMLHITMQEVKKTK
jgi:predicted phosphoadenosine phosphosulfate sulfurtransferase